MTRVLALHGMTLSGAVMQRQFGNLRMRLEKMADVTWLDAPHHCSAECVERHYAAWQTRIPEGPHFRWWDASDDGRFYEGWEASRDLLATHIARGAPPILLGFSQGAIAATAAASLSQRGLLPPLAGAILIAGFPPRADEIVALHSEPIELPSLHIWGTGDRITGEASPLLLDWFTPARRKAVTWHGFHTIPRRGAPAEAILEFVRDPAPSAGT